MPLPKLSWREFAFPLCLIGFLLFGIASLLFLATGGDIPFDYGIVLDAGSSHTTVTLYKWMGDQQNGTGVVHEVTSCETESGIDDHEEKVDRTIEELMPCVENVTAAIDFDEKGSTLTILGATAGMRLLKLKNTKVSRRIFSAIKNELVNYVDEDKRLNVKSVRAISGQEEGFYLWTAANFLSDNFNTTKNKEPSTVGVLDCGGASIQIAFETKAQGGFLSKEVVETSLYGRDYVVRAASNLCWGGDEAIHRHLLMLLLANSGSTEIDDPCLNEGAVKNITGRQFDEWICIRQKDGSKVYDRRETYTFRGAYNERRCNEAVQKMLDIESCEKTFVHCFEEEQFPPPDGMKFVAVSTFYFVTRALPIRESVSLKTYIQDANQYCLKSWDRIVADQIHEPKYAINYCFLLSYLRHTVTSVYKFEESHWRNLRFLRKINKATVGWSLGMMINETTTIMPLDPTPSVIEAPTWIVLSVISVFILAASYIIKNKCDTVK